MSNSFTFPAGFESQLQNLVTAAHASEAIDPSSQQTKNDIANVYDFILSAITGPDGNPAAGVNPAVWEWVNGALGCETSFKWRDDIWVTIRPVPTIRGVPMEDWNQLFPEIMKRLAAREITTTRENKAGDRG